MDSISPLAKILAEANGINWRSIQGSGEGGSVVEQDILNYLSRIMSGDEEPPATPVDEAPPGWTGEMPPMPAAVAASGLQALSAAGVESDITDFVAQQQTGQATTVQPAPEATAPEPLAARPLAEETAAPIPVEIAPPVPEYGLADHGSQVEESGLELEDEPEAAEADTDADMEFELDDDLDDEPESEDAPVPTSEAAVPIAATLPVPEPVALVSANPEPTTPVPEVSEPAIPEPIIPESVAAVQPTADPVVAEPIVAEPVFSPSAAAAVQPDVTVIHERPAYDPAPLDEEAEFVLADAFPVPSAAQEAVQETAPHEVTTPEPVTQEAATQQTVVQEAVPAAAGFGLGGFLSRLYGNSGKTEPVPVPEPVSVPEPVQPEAAIGAAHSEHEAESVQDTAVQGTDETEAGAPEFAERVLGEPLTSQAPPISDTPVAAPLVADQWRDQETAPEEVASTEAQPEFLLADTDAEQGQEALTDSEAGQPHGGHPEAETAVHEAPALPEAHEGGLGTAESHLEEAHAAEPQATETHNAGLGAAELGVAGLGIAGLAAYAQAHHDQPQASADPVPAAAHGETPVYTDVPAGPHIEAAAEPEVGGPAEQAGSAAAVPVQVVSAATAVTLRLNVDLSVLETARVQLSEALYRDVPVTLLVARAAARSLSTLGLSAAGGVALADHAGQPLAADLSGDFRASLAGLSEAAHGTPALLVIDASGLGLDELHRGECSLSVGRTSGEGAALSLRGEIDPVRGAHFLHEVAGLLNTPIRLLF